MKQTQLNFGSRPSFEGSSSNPSNGKEGAERVSEPETEDNSSSAPPTPPKASANENGHGLDSEESELTDTEEEDEISIVSNPRLKQNSSSSSSFPSVLQPAQRPSNSPSSRKNAVGTSTSAGADTSNGQIKRRSKHGQSDACHAHHMKCGDLIRCTYMIGQVNQRRCPMKWCPKSIEFYGSTVEKLKSVKRSAVAPSVRAVHSPEETFIFKCPRCQDACICARCRRAKGLEPIQRQLATQAAQAAQDYFTGQSSKSNQNPGTSASSSKPASFPSVFASKTPPTPAPMPTSKAQPLPLSKPLHGFASGRAGNPMPPPAAKAAKASSSKSPHTIKKSPSKFKVKIPIKRPPDMPAPDLEKIETSLHSENLFARAYIYETLNRFSLLKVPRSLVAKLDRFDQWTHKNVQDILERVLLLLSALDKLESGTPVASSLALVRAWRKSGKDLSRGEVWKEAVALVEEMEIPIFKLPALEHMEDEGEDEPEGMPQPISSRLTRRRAAAAAGRNGKGYRDTLSSDGESESDSDDDSSEEEDEDSDGSANARGHRRSTRTKAAVKGSGSRRSIGDESSASASAARQAEASKIKEKKKEAEKIPAPPFEEKIEALVGLLDLALATQNVADDLKDASEALSLLEKSRKEAAKARDNDFHAQVMAHEGKNPGALSGEAYREWKKARAEITQKKVEEDRDADMRFRLESETLRLRSGPLGKDIDGNEYWQLSQSDKSMPSQTQGRYAWSLLVWGKPYISPLSLKPTSATDPILIDEDGDEDEDEKKRKSSLKRTQPSSNPLEDTSSLSSAQSDDESTDANEDGHQEKKSKLEGTDGESSASGRKESKGSGHENGKGKGKSKEEESEVKVKPKKEGKSFYGTNFPKEINQVMAFVRYRQQLKDYNEWVQLARDPKATRAASMRLESDQNLRKKQIDRLVQSLKEVREYYIWHTGEEINQSSVAGNP